MVETELASAAADACHRLRRFFLIGFDTKQLIFLICAICESVAEGPAAQV
jgi:hypothetical protein